MDTFSYTEAGNVCPLCKRPAICTLYDGGNHKYVRCENCNEFLITCVAEQILSPQPATFLAQYSALSKKSNDEQLLLIKSPSADSKELVHVKWKSRS